MKKILILTIIFLASGQCSKSQSYMQLGAGYSTLHYPVAELAGGYDFGPVLLQGGYLAHTTRNVNGGAIFNARVGKHISISDNWFAEPSAGYAYTLRSNDNKELNTQSVIAGVYAGKVINNGELLIGANYTEKTLLMCVTIRCKF